MAKPSTPVRITDGIVTAPLDAEDGGLLTIDTVHTKVHQGKVFQAHYLVPNASKIADNGQFNVLVVVSPDVEDIEANFEFIGNGNAELYLYEGPTVTVNGTGISVVHMNRTKLTGLHGVVLYHTPTTTNDGALLYSSMMAGGTGVNPTTARGAGTLRNNTEWILASDTKYLFRLINRSGAAQQYCFGLQWYME